MEHWIYLQLLLDYGCINTRKVIENIKDISVISKMSDGELRALGVPESRIKRRRGINLGRALELLRLCQENHILVIPYNDRKYPQKLKNMENPPVVLYAMGDIPDFDHRLSVAVVGQREITDRGSRAAFSLSARLALAGALVISGGAVGGDFYSHNGAMAVGEPTVNVTGGGLLSGYLKSNKLLRKDIVLGGGLLLSEFAPDYVPKNKNSFHLRNRVIAALSEAVVVIEAKGKSGTLITAHQAMGQGKEVFAYVGDSEAPEYEGCRSLIDDGAEELKAPEDLLSLFPNYSVNYDKINSISNRDMKELFSDFLDRQKAIEEYKARNKSQKENPKTKPAKTEKPIPKKVVVTPEGLTPECSVVFEAIDGQALFADEIVLKTNLSTGAVLTALTMLEVRGLVESLPGSRYRLRID